MTFEQTFKNIDDILCKDAGANNNLDYMGQTSWIMFLRNLDELELVKANGAELKNKEYQYIRGPEYRWPAWTMPKGSDGRIGHNFTMTEHDLAQFEAS